MNINIKVEKSGAVTVKHEIPNAESGKQLYETLIHISMYKRMHRIYFQGSLCPVNCLTYNKKACFIIFSPSLLVLLHLLYIGQMVKWGAFIKVMASKKR